VSRTTTSISPRPQYCRPKQSFPQQLAWFQPGWMCRRNREFWISSAEGRSHQRKPPAPTRPPVIGRFQTKPGTVGIALPSPMAAALLQRCGIFSLHSGGDDKSGVGIRVEMTVKAGVNERTVLRNGRELCEKMVNPRRRLSMRFGVCEWMGDKFRHPNIQAVTVHST